MAANAERRMKMATNKKPASKKSDPTPIYTQVVKSRGVDPLKGKPPGQASKSVPARLVRDAKASKQKKSK
jgi:hypothetical protein